MSPANEGDGARARTILTPSSLNRLARDLIEDALPLVWVEGELSNVSRPASGHLYFTLKDSAAQVRCAMFKPRSTWLPFKPTDGMQVLARARVSLYEARGEFQLIAEHLEPAGEGALRREFERLKARLAAEGLFDAARKRALPAWPRRIGVITSATGAAVRDVLSVLGRRFPLVEVDVLPVPVQGNEAAPAIATMLAAAAAAARHDVLLLTRGGGSLEDLWAFNDERVARAIVASPIPVVAAIGHETDVSIADFVADLRAPTPSAAAELLVPDQADLGRLLQGQRDRLVVRQRHRLEALAQHLDHWHARLQALRPGERLARGHERLLGLRRRLEQFVAHGSERRHARLAKALSRLEVNHPGAHIQRTHTRLDTLQTRLCRAVVHAIERRRMSMAGLARTLQATSPLATLSRGYAILFDADSGRVLRSVGDVTAGTALRARLVDGEIRVRVMGE
ncbi:MAG TPA: exodeoxyribonuclease VII large subunit [Dokdonella sp.]|uniref:exodeoxyribonuclease VII large subunit n=1 Tax=Dokdonella sp. TaxID=2291710 RepID=UPI0025C22FF2|nr:exodeoxyribonuclease VII large subunit [Dokdonella sp.]MBX3693104.1 exodeoxyribonuclease VII large subunit [Dokdonella sp.]HNR91365.1 exodeoxyribonuclease VII large subunit [Dokdonella sp.]